MTNIYVYNCLSNSNNVTFYFTTSIDISVIVCQYQFAKMLTLVVTMGIGGLGMDSSRKLMLESWYEFMEFALEMSYVFITACYMFRCLISSRWS